MNEKETTFPVRPGLKIKASRRDGVTIVRFELQDSGEKMIKSRDRIPNEVLKEIFSGKVNRCRASDWVYTQLKQMILAGKLKKGKRLVREEIAKNFDVSEGVVSRAFSQLKKERLIISKGRKGSFVA